MKIRIVKSGPGCVFTEGQVIRVADRQAREWIRTGFAVPSDGDSWNPIEAEPEKPQEVPTMLPFRNIDREGNVNAS